MSQAPSHCPSFPPTIDHSPIPFLSRNETASWSKRVASFAPRGVLAEGDSQIFASFTLDGIRLMLMARRPCQPCAKRWDGLNVDYENYDTLVGWCGARFRKDARIGWHENDITFVACFAGAVPLRVRPWLHLHSLDRPAEQLEHGSCGIRPDSGERAGIFAATVSAPALLRNRRGHHRRREERG